MFVIRERETFPIVRKLSDPSDSATYYVRAVVRNAISGATLNTVDLTNDGNSIQRFVGTFTAPADASGQGLYIDIVTKVYTNSGYTTQDSPYSDEVDTYLVGQRFNYNLANSFAGAIGPDINYKKIKELVDSAVAGIKIPEIPEHDMSPMMEKMRGMEDKIQKMIGDIEMPETDLTSVFGRLSSLEKAVRELPQPKDVDFSPIISEISSLRDDVKNKQGENSRKVDTVDKRLVGVIGDLDTRVAKKFKELSDKLSTTQFIIKLQPDIGNMFKEEDEPSSLSRKNNLTKSLQ